MILTITVQDATAIAHTGQAQVFNDMHDKRAWMAKQFAINSLVAGVASKDQAALFGLTMQLIIGKLDDVDPSEEVIVVVERTKRKISEVVNGL